MGVIVRVVQVQRVRGGLQLLIQGEQRAWALEYRRTGERDARGGGAAWSVEQPVWNEEDPAFKALDRELRDRSVELGRRRGIPDEALDQLVRGHRASRATSRTWSRSTWSMPAEEKQELLEMLAGGERMRRVLL